MSNKFHDWLGKKISYLKSIPLTEEGEIRLQVYQKVLKECLLSPSPVQGVEEAAVKRRTADQIKNDIAIDEGWGSWSALLLDYNQNKIGQIIVEQLEYRAMVQYASQGAGIEETIIWLKHMVEKCRDHYKKL